MEHVVLWLHMAVSTYGCVYICIPLQLQTISYNDNYFKIPCIATFEPFVCRDVSSISCLMYVCMYVGPMGVKKNRFTINCDF